MPSYTFRNNQTSEVFDQNMSISDKEEFLKNNPHLQQIFNSFPGVVDPVTVGRVRVDDNFRDVLKNVKSHHRRNNINDW